LKIALALKNSFIYEFL
jgi:hypothetical protein